VVHCPASGVNVYSVVAVLFIAGDQDPVTPLVEVVGKDAKAAPEQIGATWLNVATIGFTTIVIVAGVTVHCPESGENIYSVVVVLFIAGDQVPVTPLVEVVGKDAKAAPEQIGAIWLKMATIGFTTIVILAGVVVHCPASGENVYSVVAVLFIAGDQDPVTPLVEVVGKDAKAAPEQIGFTWLNVATIGFTTMVIVEGFTVH
jgi:pimeloyl-ACP methyl ester carboxylesterase